MTPKGRTAKAKARLNAYDKLAGQEAKEREAKLELYIPPGPRLGSKVIELGKRIQVLRRQAAVRESELFFAAGWYRGHYWPEWSGQDELVSADLLSKPSRILAPLTLARPSRWPTSIRNTTN